MDPAGIRIEMTPPHPGSYIREDILEPLELSISKAAAILKVRRATLSDLVNERARLSPEMALRLEKAFGASMEQMLKLQAWYDTVEMRRRAAEFDVSRYDAA